MNNNIVRQFRHDIYGCFPKAKDALFNTVDALMSEPQATSLPEITQSLWFERQWSSVYEGLEDGRIDQSTLREVFWRYAPRPLPGHHLWMGIDVSGIARPFRGPPLIVAPSRFITCPKAPKRSRTDGTFRRW